MKSLRNFLLESKQIQDFPIKWLDVNFSEEDSDMYHDDALEDFQSLFDKMNAGCVVFYTGPKSIKAKRNTNLEYYDAFPDIYVIEQTLGEESDKGFVVTFEDEYTLGVSYYISGPLPAPKWYIRFVKDAENDVKDDVEDGKEPKDFIKIPRSFYTFPDDYPEN